MTDRSARLGTAVRWSAGVLVLLGGSVHLQQWYRNYRELSIGPLFLINVSLSILAAVALFLSHDRRVILGALALSLGTLSMLIASRTIGLPGFVAVGYDRPEIAAIMVESLAVVALGIAASTDRAGG